jgi:alpha-tubulin suppressor-like RCC1 family protein
MSSPAKRVGAKGTSSSSPYKVKVESAKKAKASDVDSSCSISIVPASTSTGNTPTPTPTRSRLNNAVAKIGVLKSQTLEKTGFLDPEQPAQWGSGPYLRSLCASQSYNPLSSSSSSSSKTNKKNNEISVDFELVLNQFNRSRLLQHLRARNVTTSNIDHHNATKKELVHSLVASLEEERVAEVARLANAEETFREIATREEAGAVYAVGRNDKGQCGLGLQHECSSKKQINAFTVIAMTRGLGVHRVICHGDISFAVIPSSQAQDNVNVNVSNNDNNNPGAGRSGGAVYTWGGCRLGPTGIDIDLNEETLSNEDTGTDTQSTTGTGTTPQRKNAAQPVSAKFELNDTPISIASLEGEEVQQLTVGASHGAAITQGGDMFTWGDDTFGVMGVGVGCPNVNANPHSHSDDRTRKAVAVAASSSSSYCRRSPTMLSALRDEQDLESREIQFRHASAGNKHTCAVATNGSVYGWGYGASGRLGVGQRRFETPNGDTNGDTNGDVDAEKVTTATSNSQSVYISHPRLCHFATGITIVKVACGAEHSLGMSSNGEAFSWGCGDNGRLGLGDRRERWSPIRIPSLHHSFVTDISAGTWHSACVAIVPPFKRLGLLYTWVSRSRVWVGLPFAHRVN